MVYWTVSESQRLPTAPPHVDRSVETAAGFPASGFQIGRGGRVSGHRRAMVRSLTDPSLIRLNRYREA